MFRTKEVDLGGDLRAVIRRPDFAVWVLYEDLLFDRYEADEAEAKLSNEEKIVRAQMEREGQAVEKGPHVKKFTAEKSRRISKYVQDELLVDALVALKEGDDLHVFIREDGSRVLPPPIDFRDIGPHRCMDIAHEVTFFVYETRSLSFRARREDTPGNSEAPALALTSDGATTH
jgi:hypothetical protein